MSEPADLLVSAAYVVTMNPGREVIRDGAVAIRGGRILAVGKAEALRRADNGETLWSMPVQTGVIAPPMTYEIDGEQYIALMAGWGGAWATFGKLAYFNGPPRNISRLLVFKLGAKAALPPAPSDAALPLDPPPAIASKDDVAAGKSHYARFCLICHGDAGVAAGLVPDLRYTSLLADDAWFDVVLGGARKDAGMVSFAQVLDKAKAAQIRAYLIARAHEDKAAENASK